MSGHWEDCRKDLERTLGRPPSWWHFPVMPCVHAGVRATFCYRLARCFRRVRALRPIAALLKRIALVTTGAEISPAAVLGGGLHLPHPQGVVIGPTVRTLGECTVLQGATLGPRGSDGDPEDGPTMERLTFVYPGARVLGKVRVGARSQIGPNCVLYRDLPAGSTVLPPDPRILEGLSFTLRERLPDEPEPGPEPSRAEERAMEADR